MILKWQVLAKNWFIKKCFPFIERLKTSYRMQVSPHLADKRILASLIQFIVLEACKNNKKI